MHSSLRCAPVACSNSRPSSSSGNVVTAASCRARLCCRVETVASDASQSRAEHTLSVQSLCNAVRFSPKTDNRPQDTLEHQHGCTSVQSAAHGGHALPRGTV
jgi:hypothetical protein